MEDGNASRVGERSNCGDERRRSKDALQPPKFTTGPSRSEELQKQLHERPGLKRGDARLYGCYYCGGSHRVKDCPHNVTTYAGFLKFFL
ncbi:unnamed protein product [Meloidogyne enterolobii]|uniref:Uncharacterized protein n=1 Tax=Meloidogyne enterolobii TaxID=390850 RepID=A0ACB0YIM3_MELEN